MSLNKTKKTLKNNIDEIIISKDKRLNNLPRDYFSWGRDRRHKVDDTEKIPKPPSTLLITLKKFFKI